MPANLHVHDASEENIAAETPNIIDFSKITDKDEQ
jgi:hypothetical protein